MTGGLQRALARVVGWLPRGQRLSDARWPIRHRAMVWVLWVHVPALWAGGDTVRLVARTPPAS